MTEIKVPPQWVRFPAGHPELQGYQKGKLSVVVSEEVDPQGVRWRHVSASFTLHKPPLDKLLKVRKAFFAPGAVVTQESPFPDSLPADLSNCAHLYQRLGPAPADLA